MNVPLLDPEQQADDAADAEDHLGTCSQEDTAEAGVRGGAEARHFRAKVRHFMGQLVAFLLDRDGDLSTELGAVSLGQPDCRGGPPACVPCAARSRSA